MLAPAAPVSHILSVPRALVKDGCLSSHPLLLQTGLRIKILVDISSAWVEEPCPWNYESQSPCICHIGNNEDFIVILLVSLVQAGGAHGWVIVR